jgi:hypothetical protein
MSLGLVLAYLALGLTIGLISGALGIGGGVLIVPALVWLFRFDYLRATGTSLAVLVLPVVALGAWRYYSAGRVDVTAAVCIAVAFFVGGLSLHPGFAFRGPQHGGRPARGRPGLAGLRAGALRRPRVWPPAEADRENRGRRTARGRGHAGIHDLSSPSRCGNARRAAEPRRPRHHRSHRDRRPVPGDLPGRLPPHSAGRRPPLVPHPPRKAASENPLFACTGEPG